MDAPLPSRRLESTETEGGNCHIYGTDKQR